MTLIYHLSSTDALEGAARGAYRVHSGLKAAGEDSRFLVARKSGLNPDVIQVTCGAAKRRWSRWCKKILERWKSSHFKRGPRAFTFCSLPRSSYRPVDLLNTEVPDLYHLHWVANFLDWPTMLPWLASRAPVVWTFRDLNPIQGIWHYEPDVQERTVERDRLNEVSKRIKQRALDDIPANRLSIIASSRWMEAKIRASDLFHRFQVRLIPHGLETETFRPFAKELARAALGFPDDKSLILGFVAGDVSDPRKGLSQLYQALEKVRGNMPIRLFTVGSQLPASRSRDDVHFGQIQNDRLLALFYNALDLFVCPSLQEAFGQTVFESMSCGTPVVGFNAGGIPDMVRAGQNGWLASVGDVQSLAAAIQDAIVDQPRLGRFGSTCRKIVEEEYRLDIQAQAYRQYYSDILSVE